ncbi:MAG: type II secretion system F family protein [Lentisphaerae bacterium]|nr:type II secretion system F family protein [Lentisphaerota bacterium]
MAGFTYVARNQAGQVVRAALDAADRQDALSRLRAMGLIVVDLAAQGEAPAAASVRPAAKTRRPLFRMEKSISTSEKSVFCRQLSITVNAGMPLRDALESIANDMDHPTFRKVLLAVVARLHQGESFSHSIERFPQHFSTLFVALVRAAEESGSLPETLDQLAGYMERSEKLIKKIKAVTSYPMFILVFFLIVSVVMTAFVLPKFMDSFKGFDVVLPPLTRFVFGMNAFVLGHWYWFVGAIVVPVVSALLYRRNPKGRYNLDAAVLKLPFFGVCIREFALARFCRNLSIMLRGGVGITTAMDITSAVSGNVVIVESMLKAKERILSGERIAASLAKDKEVPKLIIRMVGVGEESGRLPEVLDKVATLYEEYVENRIVTATSMFEPVVICLFGGVVLVLVLAIYLPIFTVSQGVK